MDELREREIIKGKERKEAMGVKRIKVNESR